MNFAACDTQLKSRLLALSLLERGHVMTPAAHADVLLVDIDDPDAPHRGDLIAQAKANDALVLLYPHGAVPTGTYDGYYEPDPRIDAQLVHGPGIADVVAAAGIDRPCHVIGWSYSPHVEFRPPWHVERVLFGPLHPFGSGQISDDQQDLNRQVFDALMGLPDVEVAVQLFGSPGLNGLPVPWHVNWIPSTLKLDWAAIDQADLVIAEGTLAMLALARGKPVVWFGSDTAREDENARPRRAGCPYTVAPRFPIDFADGPLPVLVEKARAGSREVDEWTAQFVGGPFDPDGFCDLVEGLVAERGLVAA